ncbi:hypothetical protein ABG067_004062 [Albugo candida]
MTTQTPRTMKSLIFIWNILALITCADGESLRTSSENRVLSIPASDSMTTGFNSGHQTHGLSPGMEYKLQANDKSSRSLVSFENHEDSKSSRDLGSMNPASCSNLPGRIPSNFQTEEVNCEEMNPIARAECNSKHTRSFSKSQNRKLMDGVGCSPYLLLRPPRQDEEGSGQTAGYAYTYTSLMKNPPSDVFNSKKPQKPKVEALSAQNPTKNDALKPPHIPTSMKRDA